MRRVYKSGRIRLTGSDLADLRFACWRRDGGRCVRCNVAVSDYTLLNKYDMAHIKSRGAGGSDVLENVKTLCHQCHMREHSGR